MSVEQIETKRIYVESLRIRSFLQKVFFFNDSITVVLETNKRPRKMNNTLHKYSYVYCNTHKNHRSCRNIHEYCKKTDRD